MTTHLVAFADASMSRSLDLCWRSALAHGADRGLRWGPDVLRQYGFDLSLLSGRGCGYWKWKPFIISYELNGRFCEDGDILIYSDAGVEFLNNVNYIIDRMDQDIFLFGNMYEHAHWCKRDVVDQVWSYAVTLPDINALDAWFNNYQSAITPWDRFGKQVQASVIFFRVSDYSRKFVKEWLDWCLFEGGRLIDDSPSRLPNHPEFQEHRHDQAILTTMAYREGLRLHYWPASYNDGAFTYERGNYPDEGYPVLFNHHRRRNHEWSNAA